MAMYLSRLILDPRSRAVRTDLHDCNQLKRTVLKMFPQASNPERGAREQFGVLYRQDREPHRGVPSVIIQSSRQPDWTQLAARDARYLLESPECKDVQSVYERLREGQELRFRLRANPTRRLSSTRHRPSDPLAGNRVELQSEDAQIDWLGRKAEQCGFALSTVRTIPDLSTAPDVFGLPHRANSQIPDVRATSVPKLTGRSGSGQRLTFGTVVFDGHLRISDCDLFLNTLRFGIGPAKAYGFGLLSVAPVR